MAINQRKLTRQCIQISGHLKCIRYRKNVFNQCELLIISAPRIKGSCTFVNSTKDSLTFTWNSATSATSYRLVGDGVDETSSVNTITAKNLQPGTRYAFTVWAVGESDELTSNNITCVDSTGTGISGHSLFSNCILIALHY